MVLGRPLEKADLEAFATTRHCIQLILGRDALSSHEVVHYSQFDVAEILRSLVRNLEFRVEVETPVTLGGTAAGRRFYGEPSQRFFDWLGASGIVSSPALRAIEEASGWRSILKAVWADEQFRELVDPDRQWRGRFDGLVAGLDAAAGEVWLIRSTHGQFFHRPEGNTLIVAVPGRPVPSARAFDIDLLPQVRSFRRVRKTSNGFSSIGEDPQILFGGLDPGRHQFIMDLSFRGDRNWLHGEYAQIFFDLGNDFREEHSLKFPLHGKNLVVNALVESATPILGLRVDPCIKPGVFHIERCGVNTIDFGTP